jgi:hypothetical protein
VISDPHFYDRSLGTTGSALEEYLAQDRKMIRESEASLAAAVKMIRAKRPDFVIVSGDLTKDGEYRSHQRFARYMAHLEAAGIEVYVCPGNHDINNPHAFSYKGDTVTPVPSVSPEEFTHIYRKFGYEEALDRDPASLSYLAEPMQGLWLISIDSCKYENNTPELGPETGGAIRAETMAWVMQKLAEAQQQGKSVFAFMHHGATEHYAGQSLVFSEYVIDDWQVVSGALADAGLKLVFTGHYHANDITRTTGINGAPTLLDVETGSLITYPSPIRFVSLHNDQAAIHTEYVTRIRYDTGGVPFPEYARQYLYEGLAGLAFVLLQQFGLDAAGALNYAPAFANGFIAHYAGDEQMTPEAGAAVLELLGSGQTLLGQMLGSLWTDLAPPDTHGLLDLAEVVPAPITGDLDGDGDVDRRDIDLIKFHINQPAGVYPAADLDGDGMIAVHDIAELGPLCTRRGCR